MEGPGWLRNVKWTCTNCNSADGCKCWVKLTCKWCDAKTHVLRFPEAGDYDHIETECPKCRSKSIRP